MGCHIMKGVTEQCTVRLRLTLKVEQGKPIIKFISLRQIARHEELVYDYSDWSQVSKKNISLAKEINKV